MEKAITSLSDEQANMLSSKLIQSEWSKSKDIILARQKQAVKTSADFAAENFVGAKMFHSKHAVMDYAISQCLDNGFVAEFGVYKGLMLNYIADKFDQTVYGFDVFTVLPEAWRIGYDKGHFDTMGMDLKFADNCKLYKGLFSETLPVFKNEVTDNVKLIHVDSDLYSSARDILFGLSDRFVSGTVIVFDEFINLHGWENGEVKAWEEFVSKSGVKFEYIAWNVVGEEVVVKII